MGFDIRGKVCLVTGANRGIGKTITEVLLAKGVSKVYAAVRNPESAHALLAAHGDPLIPLQLDLSKPETIRSAAKTAGDVQLVINNGGILRASSALNPGAIDSLQEEMEVNVYGLIRMAQAFAPILKKNGGGAFVQLNSVVSLKTFADFATYCASKAAAYAITQGLKDELKTQGTQVVSVHPGPIATDMAGEAGLHEVAESPVLVAEAIIAALKNDQFHAWPDSMARQIGGAYQTFAERVILAEG